MLARLEDLRRRYLGEQVVLQLRNALTDQSRVWCWCWQMAFCKHVCVCR